MPPKRKRESSAHAVAVEVATPALPVAGPSNTSTTADHKGKGKAKQQAEESSGQDGETRGNGALVHYQVEDGSVDWWKALDLSRDRTAVLRKLAKRLNVPVSQALNIKLWHVRDEGEAARIIDDLDWQTFRTRAADPDAQMEVRIRLPGADASASATPPLSTPLQLPPSIPSAEPLPIPSASSPATEAAPTKKRAAPAKKTKDIHAAPLAALAAAVENLNAMPALFPSPEFARPKAKRQKKAQEQTPAEEPSTTPLAAASVSTPATVSKTKATSKQATKGTPRAPTSTEAISSEGPADIASTSTELPPISAIPPASSITALLSSLPPTVTPPAPATTSEAVTGKSKKASSKKKDTAQKANASDATPDSVEAVLPTANLVPVAVEAPPQLPIAAPSATPSTGKHKKAKKGKAAAGDVALAQIDSSASAAAATPQVPAETVQPAITSVPIAPTSTDKPKKSKSKKEKKHESFDNNPVPSGSTTPLATSPIATGTPLNKHERKAERKRQKAFASLAQQDTAQSLNADAGPSPADPPLRPVATATPASSLVLSKDGTSSDPAEKGRKRKRESLSELGSAATELAVVDSEPAAKQVAAQSAHAALRPAARSKSDGPRQLTKSEKNRREKERKKRKKTRDSMLSAREANGCEATGGDSIKHHDLRQPGSSPASPASSSPGSDGIPVSAPSTPSPQSFAPNMNPALLFADKYKPARPSPLGRTFAIDSPTTASGDDTPTADPAKLKNPSKRSRKIRREEQRMKSQAGVVNSREPGQVQTQRSLSQPTVEAPEEQSSLARVISSRPLDEPARDHPDRIERTDEAHEDRPSDQPSGPASDIPAAGEKQADLTPPVAVNGHVTTVSASPRPNSKPTTSRESSTPVLAGPAEETSANDARQPLPAYSESVETSFVHTPAAEAEKLGNAPSAGPTSPKTKKTVQLSADFDLFRRPKESQHDSSSINGSRRRSSQLEDDSGISSASGQSSDDDDATRDRSSGSPSVTLPSLVVDDEVASNPNPNGELARSASPSESVQATTQASAPASTPSLDRPADEAVAAVSTAVSEVPETNGVAETRISPSELPRRSTRVLTPVKKAPVRPSAEQTGKVAAKEAETGPPSATHGGIDDRAPLDTPETDGQLNDAAVATPSAPASKNGTLRYNKGGPSKGGKGQSVPCVICLRAPDHLQKDCPEVKAGSAALRTLLSIRQSQQAAIGIEEDDLSFADSVEAIEEWLERTDKIANKVEGVKKSDFRPRSPLKVMGSKTGESIDLNGPAPVSVRGSAKSKKKAKSPSPTSLPAVVEMAGPEATHVELTGPPTDATRKSPVAPVSPDTPASEQDAPYYPPIHLRAMQKARRPGSHSGLSVSDAIIETEPSDESSSDDDEDQDGSALDKAMGEEDEGDESDSEASTSMSSSSVVSSDSEDSTQSATSRVPLPSNPRDAMSFSLTRELSAREKKKARLSAAKMHPVAYDDVSALNDDEEDEADVDEPSPPRSPVRPRPNHIRADSESSIGDYEDNDAMSRRSSIDSTIQSPFRTQAPPVIASSAPQPAQADAPSESDGSSSRAESESLAQPDKVASESAGTATSTSTAQQTSQSTKSGRFQAIDEDAESNTGIDDSPGAQAVRRGIAEEEEPFSTAMEQSQPLSSPRQPVATQTLSQAVGSKRGTRQPVSPTKTPRATRASLSPQTSMTARKQSAKAAKASQRSRRARSTSSSSEHSEASYRSAGSGSVSPPPNGQERQETATPQPSPLPETQKSQLDPSLPIPSQSQPDSVPMQTQTSPTRHLNGDANDASPLFMTQGSQIPATQAYETQPKTLGRNAPSSPPPVTTNDSSPPPSPSSSSSVSADEVDEVQPRSPKPPTDEEESDDDTWVPARRPTPPPSSQPTASIYPSLSSLSADLLRGSLGFFNPRATETPTRRPSTGTHASLPARAANGHHPSRAQTQIPTHDDGSDDSGSGSDSSEDETRNMPSAMKSRFASGGLSKKKSASQPISW